MKVVGEHDVGDGRLGLRDPGSEPSRNVRRVVAIEDAIHDGDRAPVGGEATASAVGRVQRDLGVVNIEVGLIGVDAASVDGRDVPLEGGIPDREGRRHRKQAAAPGLVPLGSRGAAVGDGEAVESDRVDARRHDRVLGVVREAVGAVVSGEVTADAADQQRIGSLGQAALRAREAAVYIHTRLEVKHRSVGGHRDVGPLRDPDVVARGRGLHGDVHRRVGVRPVGAVVGSDRVLVHVDRRPEAAGIGREGAVVLAAVAHDIVAVVAVLDPLPDEAIATDGVDAAGDAAVGVLGVAVVALLVVGPLEPVAAARVLAGRRTVVGVVGVSVVALLESQPHVAVTAARWGAGVEAAVRVVRVAVVALLEALDHAVAAVFRDTAVVALVVVDVVAVVAAFVGTHVAVTALGELAVVDAVVAIVRVAVVALLDPREGVAVATHRVLAGLRTRVGVVVVAVVALLHALPHDSVSAGGVLAGGQARVALDGVSVVTGFLIHPHVAIAAARPHTGVEAVVAVVRVAVVADLPLLNDAIATRRERALVGALVVVDVVAVVAALTGADVAVAAVGFDAGVEAVVAVVRVAVVALLAVLEDAVSALGLRIPVSISVAVPVAFLSARLCRAGIGIGRRGAVGTRGTEDGGTQEADPPGEGRMVQYQHPGTLYQMRAASEWDLARALGRALPIREARGSPKAKAQRSHELGGRSYGIRTHRRG